MNTLIFVPWEDLDAIGGVNIVVRELARYLRSRGDGVRVASARWSGRVETEAFAGTSLFRVPMRTPGASRSVRLRLAFLLCLPLTLMRLAAIMKRERITAVNVHYFSDHVFYFVLLKRWLPFRLVISVHGSDLLGERGAHNVALLNQWAPRIDAIVACSDSLKKAAFAEATPAFRKTTVLRNCVDVSGVRACAHREDAVVSVASLIPRKGLDVLIRAFARVAPAFPGWQLWLVGSGDLQDSLRALARELGCEARVNFLGGMERSDALARVARAKIFCLSSHREGLPLVVLEAMALGTPVVATRVEGTPEVIDDGVHGLLVECGSAEKLAAALERMMKDPRMQGELASNALTKIEQGFRFETWGGQYRDLLAGRASAPVLRGERKERPRGAQRVTGVPARPPAAAERAAATRL